MSAKSAVLRSAPRSAQELGVFMENNDFAAEYQTQMVLLSAYEKWVRDFKPGDKRHDDAERELPEVRKRIAFLRSVLGIQDGDKLTVSAVKDLLKWVGDGLAKTTQNFLDVMLHDPRYSNIRFNLMTNNAEVWEKTQNGKMVAKPWEDSYVAASRAYIEKEYGLYNTTKHDDALRLLFKQREYNPIIDLVNSLEWDGTPRCEEFLVRWAKCEDSPYTREVSRLIFAGGIWRLFEPGCKFDDVAILIGTKQGEGKSSLIQWLALEDKYYGEVGTFESDKAIEQLSGKWICEISELLALTKSKEVEASKAYITRCVDKYRKPYDRNTVELPRRCIFIGTANVANPLMDKTGNRRFYPVAVHSDGYDLYKHEQECREYIAQCWAEARDKYNAGEMPHFAKQELVLEYRKAQEDAMQDDWRTGAIFDFLSKKGIGEYTCIRELTNEAFAVEGVGGHDPGIVESKDIGLIMQKMGEWQKVSSHKFAKYGVQRAWVKVSGNEQMKLPF